MTQAGLRASTQAEARTKQRLVEFAFLARDLGYPPPPIQIRTRERWQMRGQTSPFEYVTVSMSGAGLARVNVALSFEGKPTNLGMVIVNVWLKRGPATKMPANELGTRLAVKLPSGLNV